MSQSLDKLNLVAASLPFRLFVVAFGVALFSYFGPTIIVNLINPMSMFDFGVTIYIAVAGAFSFVYFFTRRLRHLLIVLPAALYFGITFLLVPPQ